MHPSLALSLLTFALTSPLTLASLLDRPRASFLQDVLESTPGKKAAAQQYCKPSGQIQDACCDFETVESVNHDLFERVHQLVATPYFRYHKVDLFKECPFWSEDGSCMNRACGVETTDEDHIPEAWRSAALGALNETNSRTSAPAGCSEISDSDFCVLEDELDSEGVYVDLLENPERFTGYAGPSASRVWKAIYEENCFTPVPFIDPARSTSEGGSGFAPVSSSGLGGLGGLGGSGMGGGLVMGGWGEGEKKLLGSLAGPRDAGDEVCLEKRVFYRVISGLHASISVHICDDYLNQETGEWAPNLPCFITRIGQHPERLENMYFTYVLLLRALSRSGPQLVRTLRDTAANEDEVGRLSRMVEVASGCPSTFDETSMFNGGPEAETFITYRLFPLAQLLKSEFKDHFRNVSRIMDCVGCDKCRLWGKMQVTGLGTALKLLFSFPDASVVSSSPSDIVQEVARLEKDDPAAVVLSRSEVVAFVNTLHRLSESLEAVDRFRGLWARRNEGEEGKGRAESASSSSSTTSEGKKASTLREAVKTDEQIAREEEEDAAASIPAYTAPGLSTPLNSAPPAPSPSSSSPSSRPTTKHTPPPSLPPLSPFNSTLTAGEKVQVLLAQLWELYAVGWARVSGVVGAVVDSFVVARKGSEGGREEL
ncbi:hypothetical protein JCM11251_000437 [Rhodosporidiobolus azoricus]